MSSVPSNAGAGGKARTVVEPLPLLRDDKFDAPALMPLRDDTHPVAAVAVALLRVGRDARRDEVARAADIALERDADIAGRRSEPVDRDLGADGPCDDALCERASAHNGIVQGRRDEEVAHAIVSTGRLRNTAPRRGSGSVGASRSVIAVSPEWSRAARARAHPATRGPPAHGTSESFRRKVWTLVSRIERVHPSPTSHSLREQ